MAIKERRTDAKINRRIIIVTGFISSRAVFVATKEVPQNITASKICR